MTRYCHGKLNERKVVGFAAEVLAIRGKNRGGIADFLARPRLGTGFLFFLLFGEKRE